MSENEQENTPAAVEDKAHEADDRAAAGKVAADAEPRHASQDAKSVAPAQDAKPNTGQGVFKPLVGGDNETIARDLDMILEIPVTLTVELGKTRLTIRELLDLAKGSLVELDGLAGELMDILVNGYLIAQGEVVNVDDKYGLRITDIITRAERINKLNR